MSKCKVLDRFVMSLALKLHNLDPQVSQKSLHQATFSFY